MTPQNILAIAGSIALPGHDADPASYGRLILRKEQIIFTRTLFSGRHLLWVLPLLAMLLPFVGVSPATAATCDRIGPNCEFDAQAIVSVSDLDLYPAGPCDQGIRLNGDFVIRAHTVTPPSPILSPSPIIPAGTIVTLHLDATRISGVGLTDGTFYQGSQGTNQNFVYPPSTMIFNSSFDLLPSQPTQLPPRPICPAQLAFQVQLYATEAGVPAISASLSAP